MTTSTKEPEFPPLTTNITKFIQKSLRAKICDAAHTQKPWASKELRALMDQISGAQASIAKVDLGKPVNKPDFRALLGEYVAPKLLDEVADSLDAQVGEERTGGEFEERAGKGGDKS